MSAKLVDAAGSRAASWAMDGALLLPLLGLALVDSINPSAIAATLVLMTQPRFTARALTYVAGVFATYFAIGAAGLLGLGLIWERLDSVLGHAVLAAVGAALLAYALLAPDKPAPREATQDARFAAAGLVAMAGLGALVTLAELSTALPYIAALTLLSEARPPLPAALALLLVYNLIFVAPPLLIIAAHAALGARVTPGLQRWATRLRAGARTTLLWLMGAAGSLLLIRSGVPLAKAMGWLD